MAKISVIIPCYNVENLIDRCLEAVRVQTIGMDSLEIICVDDASTDGTWEHLQKWEQRFPEQIMLVRCDENGRQGTARNIGLDYATSSWIAFLDSDDWIEYDYFEKLYNIAQMGSFDMVVCKWDRDQSDELTYFSDRLSDTGKKSRAMKIDSCEKRKTFFHIQPLGFSAWCKLIRRDFLIDNRIFFPEGLAYEDTFWGPLIHMCVKSVYILEEKLYHYYVNPVSTVLLKEADYHLDLLTVQTMLWNEWKLRNLFCDFKEELEYEFLYTCCLGFLKVITLRYEKPSYSKYKLLCAYLSEHLPEFEKNIYVMGGDVSEYHLTLLKMLKSPLTKGEFKKLAADVKKIGL